ncbi:MAG: hypothetical protein IMW89_15200 [Ktedonobacteraceae bacterium]|nr:hypothetical protein [Ktedonobacteraceae bacterium]
MRWAALEIIRYLPMRTEREVAHVLALAQDTQDQALQRACAEAIRRASPVTDEARRALEQAREFPVEVVRVAVEEWLEIEKRKEISEDAATPK